MIVYKNGTTYHLFPECRGVKGVKMEIEKPPKICGVCAGRRVRQFRAAGVRLLIENGLSKAEIGRGLGISRQAVWGLVQEV